MDRKANRFRPTELEWKAALLALGLAVALELIDGLRQAAVQGYVGHLYWRALAAAMHRAAPWAMAGLMLAAAQVWLLRVLLLHPRRIGMALALGWAAGALLLSGLPSVLQTLTARLPKEKLPVFAADPASMAAFLQKIVGALLMPDRLWIAFADKPALWLLPLTLPLVLGLLAGIAPLLALRRWSAVETAAKPRWWFWGWWIAAVLALLNAPRLLAETTRPGGDNRPDVIFISIDTLRRDAVGAYGNPAGFTPNLDRLAARGVRLADLRAPSSWTLPSHGAMLTGRYPWSLGLRTVADALPPRARTLAEELAARGYDTYGVVTHLFVDAPYGFGQGFDRIDHPNSERAADTVALAERWLAKRRANVPAFLFLHFYDPHWPYRPPADVPDRLLAGTTEADRREVDRHNDAFELIDALRGGPPSLTATARALYHAEIWAVDRELGRLFDRLDRAGRPTIVVVTADHGEMFGEHDMYGHGMTLFEDEIRVPGLLAGPGIPADRVVEGPCSSVDLLPTLLGCLDLPVPPGLDGRNLAAEMRLGQPLPWRWVGGENASLTKLPVRYATDNRWKWFSGMSQEIKKKRVEYPAAWYRLADEPDETVNHFGEPDVPPLDELLPRLFAAQGRGDAVTISPEQRDKLRQLGYLP